LEKTPTKYDVTQSILVFAAMIAQTKIELLRIKEQSNHAALKAKLYVKALMAAYIELQALKQLPPKGFTGSCTKYPAFSEGLKTRLKNLYNTAFVCGGMVLFLPKQILMNW